MRTSPTAAVSVLCFAKNKEYKSLMEKLSNLEITYSTETEKLRSDVERLRMSEEEAKNATNRVLSLQEEIAKLRKELHQTQSEKKTIEEWADKYKHETEQASMQSQMDEKIYRGLVSTQVLPGLNCFSCVDGISTVFSSNVIPVNPKQA